MKKRKICFLKIFNVVSIVFLLSCCIFYGIRFVKYYSKSKQKAIVESNSLGKRILDTDINNLEDINKSYYFKNDANNNYLLYSNILFRIIKIEENNVLTIISDESLTYLAQGEEKNVKDSYITNWLNKTEQNHSGILQKNLNSLISYAKNGEICKDSIDDAKNNCENYINDYMITTLSIKDYLNTGADNGFINNGEFFYLSDITSDNKIWFVNDEGKLNKGSGKDVYGVRPVIKLKENLDYVSGEGTKSNPYIIETNDGLFGKYVKLDNDIYRIIDVDGDNLKLMANDYIKNNNQAVENMYSSSTTAYNKDAYGSLAYYLNNTYLNSLSYKDEIIENDYYNGYYGDTNGFNYYETLDKTIKAKIGLISVGDIILNYDLYNYYTMTSSTLNDNYVYIIQRNNLLYNKYIKTTANIIPVITITKDTLNNEGICKILDTKEMLELYEKEKKEN